MSEAAQTSATQAEEPHGAPPPSPASGPADRRRAARQTLVTKAMLFGEGARVQPRRVYLCNISHFGVGFRAPVPFEAGQRYRLRLEVGPMRLSSYLQVVSCRPHDPQTFEVGAAFVRNELALDEPPARRAESIPRNPCRDLIPHAA